MMRTEEAKSRPQPIFFREFFHKCPVPSPRNHPPPSNHPHHSHHAALHKIIKGLRAKSKDKSRPHDGGEQLLRKSVTQEKKRSKASEGPFPKELSGVFKTLKSKVAELVRSKGGARPAREEEECAAIREKTVKRLFNQTYNLQPSASSHLHHLSNGRNSTLPLDCHYNSEKALEPKSQAKPPFDISESRKSLQSNLLNPEGKKGRRREGCDSAKRFYLKLKKNRIGLLFEEPVLDEGETPMREVPSQLGINKIMLPKRNYRHEFLQNIQKIQEGYLKIKGKAHKQLPPRHHEPKHPPHDNSKKTYEIKYRRASPRREERIPRSKTEFFHTRAGWDSLMNASLSPWETQESRRVL